MAPLDSGEAVPRVVAQADVVVGVTGVAGVVTGQALGGPGPVGSDGW